MASAVAVAADAVLIREQGKTESQLVDDIASVIRTGIARGKRRILIIGTALMEKAAGVLAL